jgi:hypothetical protein
MPLRYSRSELVLCGFNQTTGTSYGDRLRCMDESAQRIASRNISSKTYYEFRDLTAFAMSVAGNGYTRAGP